MSPILLQLDSRLSAILFDAKDACSNDFYLPSSTANFQYYVPLVNAWNCNLNSKMALITNLSAIVPIVLFYNFTDSFVSSFIAAQSSFDYYLISQTDAKDLILQSSILQNTTNFLSIDFSMLPEPISSYTILQFVIMASVILLAFSFLLSVVIHCNLVRLRSRNEVVGIQLENVKKVLPKDTIKNFKSVVYSKSVCKSTIIDIDAQSLKSFETNHQVSCSICLDDFEDGLMVLELPCKHIFHSNCVEEWLSTQSTKCPICVRYFLDDEIVRFQEVL